MKPPDHHDPAALTAQGAGVAVTPHRLATEAATDIMRQGGNAVDAAIGANAVLGVVAPEACGIGGDLFALIHNPGDAGPAALNSSGRAGQGAKAALVRDLGHEQISIDSPFAVTVPGCVDGWIAMSQRFGTMPLATVLAYAIHHAADGFPASAELAATLQRLREVLAPQDAASGLYSHGEAPSAGERLRRPELAATLRAIGRDGREAFYDGPVADAIVTATGGVLRHEDLDQQQAHWINPISMSVMGWTGWTIPPNSQSYLTLAAAWIFEQLDPPRDPEDPKFTHAAIEAYRAVAWERNDLVADPDFAPLPAAQFLDPARLQERVDEISMQRRTAWPAQHRASGGTAYLTVHDGDGMGISLIQSNYHGIGSRIGVNRAGFFLHDRGSDFTLQPGHPNELAPGKRPLHTLSPTLWTEEGRLRMLLGTRGGDFQPQTLLQTLTYLRWAGRHEAAAQLSPRWTTEEWRAGDPTVVVEPHLGDAVTAGIADLGHRVRATEGWMGGWGPVSMITTRDGIAVGAADPRVATSAALPV
ncbi:MAG: gamma-glutamyltransferase family protein [Acidimicrobiia bacterium]|nr:gamma-glutamyltransferase family protein [Acidimicrobiia bacterium]